MSRSDHAQTLSFSKFRTFAAVSCMLMLMLMLGAGCRFSTNPGDTIIVEEDAGMEERSANPADEKEDIKATPTKMSSVKNPAAVTSAAGAEPSDAVDAATSDAGVSPAATPTTSGAASTSTGGSSAPATPAAGAAATAALAGSAGQAAPPTAPTPSAAGSLAIPTLPVATPTQNPKEAACSADLANCLLRDPLAYAECLRMNQDNGCPEPDAGIPPNTAHVTTEDGKPLSQACQAELANCIARLPTPENATSCTEKARKCK
jgi:hypothetical protein